jgi:hypothetical protein
MATPKKYFFLSGNILGTLPVQKLFFVREGPWGQIAKICFYFRDFTKKIWLSKMAILISNPGKARNTRYYCPILAKL